MRLASALQQGRLLGRFALGLPGFLTSPVDAVAADANLRAGLARRSERFLATLDNGILLSSTARTAAVAACRDHPARCSRPRRQRMASRATLERLYEAGVHVRLDEFKGRAPIRRGSLTLQVGSHDFDNPLATHHLSMTTGGSRSAGTRNPPRSGALSAGRALRRALQRGLRSLGATLRHLAAGAALERRSQGGRVPRQARPARRAMVLAAASRLRPGALAAWPGHRLHRGGQPPRRRGHAAAGACPVRAGGYGGPLGGRSCRRGTPAVDQHQRRILRARLHRGR